MALSNNDLNQIDKRLESRLETQKEEILGEIDDKLSKFRSEFFEKIDPILKEVTTAREERPLLENRLEALEEIHQEGFHSLAK